MRVCKFVCLTLVKCIVILLIAAVAFGLNSPVFTNQLAMTQMGTSNEMLLVTSILAAVKLILNIGLTIAIACLVACVISDICKFAKSIKTENNIENEKEI